MSHEAAAAPDAVLGGADEGAALAGACRVHAALESESTLPNIIARTSG